MQRRGPDGGGGTNGDERVLAGWGGAARAAESTVRAAGSVTAESTSHRSHAGEGRPMSSEWRERGPVPRGAERRVGGS